MSTRDLLAERIPEPDLRRLAEEQSAESASVIIELAVPEPVVEYATISGQGGEIRTPTHVVSDPQETQRVKEAESAAKRFLATLLDEPPVFLRAARSFVATATGQELYEIARQPFTKRIERNRTLPGR